MSRYEITQGSDGDWNLVKDRLLYAWWSKPRQMMRIAERGYSRHGNLGNTPATEAHGLMLLNMIKQQLEAEDEKTNSA